MSTNQEMRLCAICGKMTVHLVKRPNHILHLLLTCLTLVWVVVWIVVSADSGSKAWCAVCGTKG